MLHGARWNSPGRRVIYAAETYASALLEILVHASGSVPRSQGYVEIEIPSGVPMEAVQQLLYVQKETIARLDRLSKTRPRCPYCGSVLEPGQKLGLTLVPLAAPSHAQDAGSLSSTSTPAPRQSRRSRAACSSLSGSVR